MYIARYSYFTAKIAQVKKKNKYKKAIIMANVRIISRRVQKSIDGERDILVAKIRRNFLESVFLITYKFSIKNGYFPFCIYRMYYDCLSMSPKVSLNDSQDYQDINIFTK